MHPSLQREMRGLPEALLTPAVPGNQAGWETSETEQLHARDMKSAPGHSLPDAPLSIRQGAIPGSPPVPGAMPQSLFSQMQLLILKAFYIQFLCSRNHHSSISPAVSKRAQNRLHRSLFECGWPVVRGNHNEGEALVNP